MVSKYTCKTANSFKIKDGVYLKDAKKVSYYQTRGGYQSKSLSMLLF